ncbi:MAG: SusC/RagA family TonB-linked outer membrane protein [Jejuia sp.]
MKKQPSKPIGLSYCALKVNLKMKLSILLFFLSLFTLQANETYSQQKKITIDLNDVSVRQFLDEIESSSQFRFVYKIKDIDLERKVTVKAKQELIATVLDRVFESTKTGYNIINKRIYLTERQHDSSTPEASGKLDESSAAPQIGISGTVVDENGVPLSGANILEKETTNGSQADFDGNFSLTVSSNNAVLVVSYIGYITQEVAVAGKTKVNITMKEDAAALDEVVVVGYGTQRVKDVTGSVVQVTEENFVKGANTNALQLLDGRAAGVQISQASSAPGGRVDIRVRGLSSINGGNGVLVVVDGVPNGNVDALGPEDIESINILKDASASAIYGARAANGVVIITTKRGRKGALEVSYSTYTAMQSVANKIDMLNGRQYMETLNALDFEADPNNATDPNYVPIYTDAEIAAIGEGFDWQDQIFRSGFIHNHQLSLSGGSEKSTYYASFNHFDNKGVLRNTGEKRYNARVNVNVMPNEKLDIKFNLNVNRTETDLMPLGTNSISGSVAAALLFDPTLDAQLNDQGRYKLNPFIQVENPEAIMQGFDQNRARTEVLGNARLQYEVLEGLKVGLNLGARITASKFDSYENRLTQRGLGSEGIGRVQNLDNTYGIAEYTLNYEKEIGDHSLKLLGGLTYETFINREIDADAAGFLSDVNGVDLFDVANPERFNTSTSRTKRTFRSYLARVNYAYKDRYLLTASLRADGVSVFSDTNKTSYFPSVSLGWQIGSEPFMENQDLFDALKLRAGYGEIGNSAINNFETLPTFRPGDNAVLGEQVLTGTVPSRIPNTNLVWETTKEINLGLDFTLLDYRLSGSLEYYLRDTEDQLFNRPVPPSTGFTSFRQNFGSVRNQGLEISLNSINIQKDNFTWETNVTFATLKNEVTEVPDFIGGQVTGGGGFAFAGDFWVVREGDPMAAFYGYQIDGIYSSQAEVDAANAAFPDGSARAGLGHPIVADINGDNRIDEGDRVVLGKPFPDYNFGINNRFKYKNFTLDIYVVGVQGIDAFNNLIAESFYPIDPDRNKLASYYLDRWTPDNPNSQFPSMVEPGRYQDGRKVNKWTVQDASYVRLKNVTLGYDTSIESLGINSANFYISLENFLTITDFDGFDPDANSSSGSGTQRGTFGDYPLARTVRIGARFSL